MATSSVKDRILSSSSIWPSIEVRVTWSKLYGCIHLAQHRGTCHKVKSMAMKHTRKDTKLYSFDRSKSSFCCRNWMQFRTAVERAPYLRSLYTARLWIRQAELGGQNSRRGRGLHRLYKRKRRQSVWCRRPPANECLKHHQLGGPGWEVWAQWWQVQEGNTSYIWSLKQCTCIWFVDLSAVFEIHTRGSSEL